MSFFYPKIKTPDDAVVFRPPGSPAWPQMFRHNNGDISVALRHPTPGLKSLGTGLGCFVMAVFPLIFSCLVFGYRSETGGRTACCMYVLLFFIAAFSVDAIGSYIGSLLNGATTVVFSDKTVKIIPGKKRSSVTRERVPSVSLAFRAVELPDLQHQSLGKGPSLRVDLAYRRKIIMTYGYDTIEVTTMINREAAERFAAALNAARDASAQSFANPTNPKQKAITSEIDPRDLPQ